MPCFNMSVQPDITNVFPEIHQLSSEIMLEQFINKLQQKN